jgi:thioredoxin 1
MSEDEELERIRREKLRRLLMAREEEKTGVLKPGVVNPLNSSNFDRALQEVGEPLMVDFWAEWCAPCGLMKPIFDNLAKTYGGRAWFGKVDIDGNTGLAQRYSVMSIPHFILFKEGVPVDRVMGAVGKQRLEGILRRYIK